MSEIVLQFYLLLGRKCLSVPFVSKVNSHVKSWGHFIQFSVCGPNLLKLVLQEGGFTQWSPTEAWRDVAQNSVSWYLEQVPITTQPGSQFHILCHIINYIWLLDSFFAGYCSAVDAVMSRSWIDTNVWLFFPEIFFSFFSGLLFFSSQNSFASYISAS